jgi:2-oxoglutarate dehydrogenase E2 component (dihydrolipoamide succinyltransferase)
MSFQVRIPPLGESVTEGVIARWVKQEGEQVAQDDVLLELETDKASMELPAERAGVLHILKQEGETVAVGDVVAEIVAGETRAPAGRADAGPPVEAADAAGAREDATGRAPSSGAAPGTRAAVSAAAPPPAGAAPTPARRVGPLSPAVRTLIEEQGLDPAAIEPSGKGGRLTKGDVLAYLDRGAPPDGGTAAPRASTPASGRPSVAAGPAAAAAPGGGSGPAAGDAPVRSAVTPGEPAGAVEADEETVPMSLVRKRIAERLVQAQHTAAILTTFNEIDMSAVMALRAQHKQRFQERHGVGLGFMSFFARACIAALAEIRAINAEIRGEAIVYKRAVHLGIAVGTPRGLVVPVVRNAHTMTFAGIEREIARLASLARDNKLAISDLTGGTFTISNGGVYGSLLSTPILNPPQSGILGMHKIQKRPVVIGDQIVVRPMMYVALSYDHRIVDGEHAVTFLVRVKESLEDPARILLEV